jgi:hypothetical protein
MKRSITMPAALVALVALATLTALAALPIAVTGSSAQTVALVSAPAAGAATDAAVQNAATATKNVASPAVTTTAVIAPSAAHAAHVPATPVVIKHAVTSGAARTAYINAMYVAVVPARERAALSGRYVLGYNLTGLACGTGCSGLFDGQVRSSFNSVFFSQPLAYQRNTLTHEAAHAYGFLYLADYTTPSWAATGGWQAQFHLADRGFAATFDAEAWAACVAWKESGFNARIDQATNICTPQAATLAMAHIA